MALSLNPEVSMTPNGTRSEHRSNRIGIDRAKCAGVVCAAALVICVVVGYRSVGSGSGMEVPRVAMADDEPDTPRAFRGRGRLVCLAEEMKELHGAEVQPVHQHVVGFRLDHPTPSGLRYPAILRTAQSEALYVDERFKKHELTLAGRIFPGTGLLEVSGWWWHRDGKTYEVYYWCDVCTIRGFTPGACACCQAEVELRERLISSAESQ